MKTKLFLVVSIFIIGTFLFSPFHLKAQAVKKGDKIIDVYYGGPNLWSSILKTYTDEFSTDIKYSSVGPVGANFEFMVTDKIGIGFAVQYARSGVKYTEDDGFGYTYNDKIVDTRFRFTPRINIHFSNIEKLDAYFVAGVGYLYSKYTYTTSDTTGALGFSFKSVVPFSYRIGIGLKYYFTDHVGIGGEFGLGSAMFTAGLTAKF